MHARLLKNVTFAMALCLVPLFTGGISTAQATGDNHVTIKDAWARMTPMSGAIFGTLQLSGQVEDQVQGITCPDTAQTVELHTTSMEDGIMKMRHVDGLALPPGLEIRMEPGGMHIMLMGLTQKKQPGDAITCTITFEHAQELTFTAKVRPLGGAQDTGHSYQ